MRAIQMEQFGGPEHLQLVDIPIPEPGPGQVRIQVMTAGLNPNDLYTMKGDYAAYIPELPYMPGYDGSGIVDALGEGVQFLKQGERVFFTGFLADVKTGSLAEYIVIDAAVVHALPEELTFAEGAALGIPTLAAYQAVSRAQLRSEDVVLIHGTSGAVGSYAVQLASRRSKYVIGTSSTKKGRESIKAWGANDAIPHLQTLQAEAELEKHLPQAPDVIIEMLADQNLNQDLDVLALYGNIVIVGARGEVKIAPRLIMNKEADIRGIAIANLHPEVYQSHMEAIINLLKAGELKPIVGAVYPLAKAPEVYRTLLERPAQGKIIIAVGEAEAC
ncbi:quinone oxidoreductase [Suicoccus acidiformans]|uniref:Quinone oxidoreductase n=1 Tax=Suicoccus acidiformans TaxID=2036206 RepID=A0A347WHT4_9LACT|nr:NADPH:quinone reductase [Suicoccus acidiformans]AXY24641.1 quinone oxidoreductase [Suicoccus acidiformans]